MLGYSLQWLGVGQRNDCLVHVQEPTREAPSVELASTRMEQLVWTRGRWRLTAMEFHFGIAETPREDGERFCELSSAAQKITKEHHAELREAGFLLRTWPY